jgi:hypothetical protein
MTEITDQNTVAYTTYVTESIFRFLSFLLHPCSPFCIFIATDLLRQRLCGRGNYATVEKSGVFRAMSVAPLPLLRSAGVNMFPLLGNRFKCLDRATARVGRSHVTSACSAVTQE